MPCINNLTLNLGIMSNKAQNVHKIGLYFEGNKIIEFFI